MNCRWYQEAVIYSLDVDTFKDSNGDGIGDFEGLRQSCRYLAALGVNCLWLLPFYPSPNRDNGYDVTDYYSVDPRLGTMGDFVQFTDEAQKHKMRVMVDLVLNHTSREHPWFKEACRSRTSPFHKYYVWRYEKPPDTAHEAIFPPEQKGIWTYEKQVKAWYLHRFYSHQPDLNIDHPPVREEMKKIMAFWLKLGVAGFRVDAVPFLVELHGMRDGKPHQALNYDFLEEFRTFLTWVKGDAIMLAEANVGRLDQLEYYGDNNRMHMVFNFLVNQALFLSLAQESAQPLAASLAEMPPIPEQCQWGMFLRNHDELSLDRLSEEQREICFSRFAPQKRMRIFARGIRRRLAPMLRGDRRRLLLAYSLLFSLPGTPVLWYGEELGMGDDLRQPGRFSVRNPMQWSSETNGGFSSAPKNKLLRPVVDTGNFSYRHVNVESAQRDPGSLLNAVEQMIRVRQQYPQFGCGTFRLLPTNRPRQILAHGCGGDENLMVAIHNFTGTAQKVALRMDHVTRGIASDALRGEEHSITQGRCDFKMEPFGYRWVRIRRM
ncbi:MAG TPA: alpha-amylase family protein [Verrucomicrobiae bacterium]|nr:alpha-amylase family protein [Verrucomicrobiae bacterium]